MLLRNMEWDEKAWRAFKRAFSPMPPELRKKAMQDVAIKIETLARNRGKKEVGLDEVYWGSKEVLMKKARFMYESMVEALRVEGYEVPEG